MERPLQKETPTNPEDSMAVSLSQRTMKAFVAGLIGQHRVRAGRSGEQSREVPPPSENPASDSKDIFAEILALEDVSEAVMDKSGIDHHLFISQVRSLKTDLLNDFFQDSV